jgi:hypothetical protein
LSDLAQGSSNILVGASLLLAATLFRRYMRRLRNDFPAAGEADRIYLYYLSACLLPPHILAAVTTAGLDLADRSPRGDTWEAVFGLIWLGTTIWAAVVHWLAGRTVSRLMGLPEGVPIFGRRDGPAYVRGKLVRAYILSTAYFLVALAVAWITLYAYISRQKPPDTQNEVAIARTIGEES